MALIQIFLVVFNDEPGKVRGVKHKIHTPRGAVVWEQCRLVPHHLYEPVCQELNPMFYQRVIVPLQSPGRSPWW